MKKTKFPTIKELEDAILFAMNDNYGRCNYQQDSYTFLAVEMVPYPVKDSGGSIDSIDFREEYHTISFREAYQYWEGFYAFVNNLPSVPVPVPVPITPINDYRSNIIEDDDLPF